jgi:molecular chaperone DnaJ
MPDPHGRGIGDLLVQVNVEVPRKLTTRQEELLRELAETEHAHVSPHRKSFFEKLKDYLAPQEEAENRDQN